MAQIMTEPMHYPDYPDICGSIRSMANAVSNLGVVTKPASQIRIEKGLWEIADSLEKRYKEDRARGPIQQAPTNRIAIPCPKCGKWIFRANVDEGYALFCSDDECGWKQKIVAQQAPALTTENIIEITKAQLDDDVIREAIHLSIHQRENFSQAEHDALIAQEREKWEREILRYKPDGVWRIPITSPDDDYPGSAITSYEPIPDTIVADIAAQAREDVLKEIEQIIPEIFSNRSRKWNTGNGHKQDLLCMIKRLRSGVGK